MSVLLMYSQIFTTERSPKYHNFDTLRILRSAPMTDIEILPMTSHQYRRFGVLLGEPRGIHPDPETLNSKNGSWSLCRSLSSQARQRKGTSLWFENTMLGEGICGVSWRGFRARLHRIWWRDHDRDVSRFVVVNTTQHYRSWNFYLQTIFKSVGIFHSFIFSRKYIKFPTFSV
jgi:hypothetical protein